MIVKRLHTIIALLCFVFVMPANAQKMAKEADAVQAAMAEVIHKYSTQADTIP